MGFHSLRLASMSDADQSARLSFAKIVSDSPGGIRDLAASPPREEIGGRLCGSRTISMWHGW